MEHLHDLILDLDHPHHEFPLAFCALLQTGSDGLQPGHIAALMNFAVVALFVAEHGVVALAFLVRADIEGGVT